MRALPVTLLLAAACSAPTPAADPNAPSELHVSAAMSLKEAFLDIEEQFEKQHPNCDVVFNFAGTQVLATQILEGAPVDVFASADRAQVERVARSGRLKPTWPFASNKLVIVTPAADTRVSAPADLTQPGLRVVLAGPNVPAGDYARSALDALAIKEAVQRSVVSEEDNVRGVIGKVAAGEADAGIVYATDVTAAVADKVRTVALTGAERVVPTYEIGVIADSARPELAGAFVNMVLEKPGQDALKRRGFLPR